MSSLSEDIARLASSSESSVPGYSVYRSGRYYGTDNVAASTSANSAGYLLAVPFYAYKRFTADRISVWVTAGAAGASVALGIYESTAIDEVGSLLLDAGTVPATAPGVSETPINFTFNPGWYWLASLILGAVPTLRSNGSTHNIPLAPPSSGTSQMRNCMYSSGLSSLPASGPLSSTGANGTRVDVRAL